MVLARQEMPTIPAEARKLFREDQSDIPSEQQAIL